MRTEDELDLFVHSDLAQPEYMSTQYKKYSIKNKESTSNIKIHV